MDAITTKLSRSLPQILSVITKYKFALITVVVLGVSGYTALQLNRLQGDIEADEKRLEEGQIQLLTATGSISDELIDLLNQRSSPIYPLDGAITSDNNPFDVQKDRVQGPLDIIFKSGSQELEEQLREVRNGSE